MKKIMYKCPVCKSKHVFGLCECIIPVDMSTLSGKETPIFEIPKTNDDMYPCMQFDPFEVACSGNIDWYCKECGYVDTPNNFEYKPEKKIKLYWCGDNNTLYTIEELKKEYGDLIKSGDIDPIEETFNSWIDEATGKNGSLTILNMGVGIDETLKDNETLYIDHESNCITTKTWLKELYADDVQCHDYLENESFSDWIDNSFCYAVEDNKTILEYILGELNK